MLFSEHRKYRMLVSITTSGEYHVRLLSREGGIFRVLLSATSEEIPLLDWLVFAYEQEARVHTAV